MGRLARYFEDTTLSEQLSFGSSPSHHPIAKNSSKYDMKVVRLNKEDWNLCWFFELVGNLDAHQVLLRARVPLQFLAVVQSRLIRLHSNNYLEWTTKPFLI